MNGWNDGRVPPPPPPVPQIGQRRTTPRPPALVPPPVNRTGNAQLDMEARLTRLEEMSRVILERLQYALDDHQDIMGHMFTFQRDLIDMVHRQTEILNQR